VSPTATTQYIVSVTDIWSCQAADTVVVNVFQVFANAGSDEDICSGGSTLLTATGGTSYAWSTGQNTDAITVSPVISSQYIVTVTGVNNCTDADTVFIMVNNPPVASTTPNGTAIRCQGDNSVGYSIIPVAEADTYTWNISPSGAGIIASAVENATVSWNFSFSGTADIWVVMENECGSDTSAVLNVQTNPIPFPNLGNDTTICSGNSLFLDAGPADSYEWNDGYDQQIHEISLSGLVIVEATLGMCSNSDTMLVNISTPVVEIGSDSIISANPITLDAGPGFSDYSWSDGSNAQTLLVSGTGWYSVTVTNEFGCTATDSVFVDITTGIEENQEAWFKIYPNPVVDLLMIEIAPVRPESFLVGLTSAEGAVLMSDIFECQSTTATKLDFSNIQPGVYFLIIQSDKYRKVFRIVH